MNGPQVRSPLRNIRVAIFQAQNSTWAHRCTYSTSHAGRAHDVLPALRIPTYIDAHFTVSGTVAAGNALASVGGNAEAGFKFLHQPQVSSQRTTKATPNPISHKGIKTGAYYPCESRADQKAVPGTHGIAVEKEDIATAGEVGYKTMMVMTTANTSTP